MALRLQAPAARRASDANLSAWFTQLADQVDALACSEPSSHRAIRQVCAAARPRRRVPAVFVRGVHLVTLRVFGVRSTLRLQLHIGDPSAPSLRKNGGRAQLWVQCSQSSRMQLELPRKKIINASHLLAQEQPKINQSLCVCR